MFIAKETLPMPDIKTEPISPSKPVYFVQPKPDDYDSDSESESEVDLTSEPVSTTIGSTI